MKTNHSSLPSSTNQLKIVVIGGTGLIGRQLVKNLQQLGHEAIAASPSTGINVLTGEGLAAALVGTDVVVDVVNSPTFEDRAVLDFFQRANGNLLPAEVAAGVKHHVALSVVGTERLQAAGYFRAKLAQEKLIQASPVPYTIVRATQFFEFTKAIADGGMINGEIRLPAVAMQPIASSDVAAALTQVALAAPRQAIVELAGPEKIPQDELVRRQLRALGDKRIVVTDPKTGYFGTPVDDQSLVPLGANPLLGQLRFDAWLANQSAVVSA